MVFTAKVESLEIRGKEEKDGKNGKYLVVKFDNEAGDRLEFIDRDEERFDYYKRGAMCNIALKVTNTSRYTNFEIRDMVLIDEE